MSTATDPIADMFSRIRNAISASKHEVIVPHSKMKETILSELKENGYIEGYNTNKNDKGFQEITVVINSRDSNSRISSIKRVSKPGRRIYTKVNEIPRVKNGRGIVIISTPHGVMNGFEASKAKLGGEVICEVY